MPIFNASSVKKTPARVAVVAAGVVSPLGFGLKETLDALLEGKDCVTPVERFPVEHCRCKTAGQVNDARLIDLSANDRETSRLHRASRMMIQALGQLLQNDPAFRPDLTVIGTTSGGMSFGENYYRALFRRGSLRYSPGWIANYLPQKPIIDAQQ